MFFGKRVGVEISKGGCVSFLKLLIESDFELFVDFFESNLEKIKKFARNNEKVSSSLQKIRSAKS